ncbi:hypothetical protein S122051_1364 [Staphylococcus aureus subsp. aureus 122051]|nr:hypothetical protein S122051_1364 [Staphylococcus aureus subsp. aureus 122051]
MTYYLQSIEYLTLNTMSKMAIAYDLYEVVCYRYF